MKCATSEMGIRSSKDESNSKRTGKRVRAIPKAKGSLKICLGLAAPYGLGQRLDCLGQRLLLIRGMQIEINAAKRTRRITLAENDGDVFIQGDAMAQLRAAAFVSLDSFVHQGDKGRLELIGGLVDTDDVAIVRFQGVR